MIAAAARSETRDCSGFAVRQVTGGEPDEALILPTRLFNGAYDLTFLMGQGSMGEVWRARNVNLDKEVAIKLVNIQSADPSADIRLRNEARLAAKMSHPNVVGVYDAGVAADGRYYLVMELLEGHDLRQVIEQRGTLPCIEAVQILVPVLAGLDCAHRRKILHRDIKPDNIFMARTDDTVVPKLVDFGIALARDLPNTLRTTRSGGFIGTPLYMAPEQVRGSLDLDERADIWAVATVLYELISGQLPFSSDDLRVLFFSITSAPVPPIDESLCDAELAAILMRGLAKDPAERWPDAREMASALVNWLLARGVTEDVSGDSLTKPWISGSLPGSRFDSIRPYSDALPLISPVPPHVPKAASAQALRRKLPWWIALLLGLPVLVLVLLIFTQMRPEQPSHGSFPEAAVIAHYRTPHPVRVVMPALQSESTARNEITRPSVNEAKRLRKVPAREIPPARVPSAIEAAEDRSPAAPPVTTEREARRPEVDPTWGF